MQHVSLGAVHTHTGINLIDKKRVDNIYSKSAENFHILKSINRLLFNKQKLVFESNFKLIAMF